MALLSYVSCDVYPQDPHDTKPQVCECHIYMCGKNYYVGMPLSQLLSGTMEVISWDLQSSLFHGILDCSFRAAALSPYALALTIVVGLCTCTIFQYRRCCSLEIRDESCLV